MRPGSDAMRLPNRSGAPPKAGEVAWNTYLKRRVSNHDTHRGDALKASAVWAQLHTFSATDTGIIYRKSMLGALRYKAPAAVLRQGLCVI